MRNINIESDLENLKRLVEHCKKFPISSGITSDEIISLDNLLKFVDKLRSYQDNRFYGVDLYNLQCLLADNNKTNVLKPEYTKSIENLIGQVSACRYDVATANSKVWQYQQKLQELVMLGKRIENFLKETEEVYNDKEESDLDEKN